jgi:hypothetical protein
VKCDLEMSHVVAEFSNSHSSPIAMSIIPLSIASCKSHCPHGAIATKDKRTKHHKHYCHTLPGPVGQPGYLQSIIRAQVISQNLFEVI